MIGNRWSVISGMLAGRTEDAVKIRWKTLTRPANTPHNNKSKKRPKTKSKSSTAPSNSKSQKENKEPFKLPRHIGCSKNLSDLFEVASPSMLSDTDSALLAGAVFADCLSKQSPLSEFSLLELDIPLQMDFSTGSTPRFESTKGTPSKAQHVSLLMIEQSPTTVMYLDEDGALNDGHSEADRLLLREVFMC